MCLNLIVVIDSVMLIDYLLREFFVMNRCLGLDWFSWPRSLILVWNYSR